MQSGKDGTRLVPETDSNKPQSEQVFYKQKKPVSSQTESSYLQICSNWIINTLETSFYKLGLVVARHPLLTILISLLVCGGCGVGMIKFEENQTNDDAKLWVPKTSRVLPEKLWVDQNFPSKTRFTTYIVEAPNILSPYVINAIYDMYLQSRSLHLAGQKDLDAICIRVGSMCHITSILELWGFNGTLIRSLTLEHILNTVNSLMKYSPVYGTELKLDYILGGVTRDYNGHIIGAQSSTILWLLKKEPELELSALDWEKQMVDIALVARPFIFNTYVYATRTFDDEGYGAVKADTSLLTAGFIIVFIFIILVLGRFNLVENKLYLSLAGICNIGLAILFCYGLAMAFGFIYGPIHALMPFLLLGIGVDDMFVIVGAYRNLTEEEQKLPVDEKIAISLKHAGVSITVTSITDIVAFGIGGSTVIPALSAFCAYAALGILGLYLLVSTFFVACLTLDTHRIEQNRNALLICYIHKDYVPNKFSQLDLVPSFIEKFYAPALMKSSTKVLIVIITVAMTSINIWSFSLLHQDFDLYNYIPSDSYATDFIKAQKHFYPDRGYDSAVYCDQLDYSINHDTVSQMYSSMEQDPYIEKSSINFWYTAYLNYLQSSNETYVTSQIGKDGYPVSNESFRALLVYFLQQREGRSYGHYIKFDNSVPPNIVGSYIPLVHVRQSSSSQDIAAMESLRNILDNIDFTGTGRCFCYAVKYLNNETNRVLQGELYRNLALAAVCVFLVTLLLIANLWTSVLVFSCVAFTVIDVTGALQFWGVTIDTASSILIILCVGLAVDYSAHVGHTFMTIAGTREVRAKATLVNIGPAVLNGGMSTFLAFVLLADSKSYGFALFFRVFMTVVLFGLFHGLVYLPVILSWLGPLPYQSADSLPVRETTQYTVTAADDKEMDDKNIQEMNIHLTNGSIKESNIMQLNNPPHISGNATMNGQPAHKGQGHSKCQGHCYSQCHHQCEGHYATNSKENKEECDCSEIIIQHGEINSIHETTITSQQTEVCNDTSNLIADNSLLQNGGECSTSIKCVDTHQRCDGCDKMCVVCRLHSLNAGIQEALSEMKKREPSCKYCTCHRHKDVVCQCAISDCSAATSSV